MCTEAGGLTGLYRLTMEEVTRGRRKCTDSPETPGSASLLSAYDRGVVVEIAMTDLLTGEKCLGCQGLVTVVLGRHKGSMSIVQEEVVHRSQVTSPRFSCLHNQAGCRLCLQPE